ncbi:MAG: hypothetical protein EON87_15635, partial [Brevundimonas sp.]
PDAGRRRRHDLRRLPRRLQRPPPRQPDRRPRPHELVRPGPLPFTRPSRGGRGRCAIGCPNPWRIGR